MVNKPEPKVDAVKLAKGRPVFTDDVEMPGMLYGGLLTSPVAHARILSIDSSDALALPGVHAVQTYADVPASSMPAAVRVTLNLLHTTRSASIRKCAMLVTGWRRSPPRPPELVQEALERIKVEYEELPAVFSPEEAMQPGAR